MYAFHGQKCILFILFRNLIFVASFNLFHINNCIIFL